MLQLQIEIKRWFMYSCNKWQGNNHQLIKLLYNTIQKHIAFAQLHYIEYCLFSTKSIVLIQIEFGVIEEKIGVEHKSYNVDV